VPAGFAVVAVGGEFLLVSFAGGGQAQGFGGEVLTTLNSGRC
jgi:hypothetical protein